MGPRAGMDGRKISPHRDCFYFKTCTLLFFEVYIIVPLYTCFVLFLVRVSSEFSGRVWRLGGSLCLPLDFCMLFGGWCLFFLYLLFLVI